MRRLPQKGKRMKLKKNQVKIKLHMLSESPVYVIGTKWTPFKGIDLVIHKIPDSKIWSASEIETGAAIGNSAKTIIKLKEDTIRRIHLWGIKKIRDTIATLPKINKLCEEEE